MKKLHKKSVQLICFFLCLICFFLFRTHPFAKTNPAVCTPNHKPLIPKPITLTQEHPWLKTQPQIQGAALEIVRDLERVRQFQTLCPDLSEEKLVMFLMDRLLTVQKTLPFVFPSTLYNVLFITSSEGLAPTPFQIFKRLYLGETELGLPFYLDVRVFELDEMSADEIISWHLSLLEGSCENVSTTAQRKSYICRGIRRMEEHPCYAQGFASLKQERGLFLDCIVQDNTLYICYAEAPLKTFNQFITPFLTKF